MSVDNTPMSKSPIKFWNKFDGLGMFVFAVVFVAAGLVVWQAQAASRPGKPNLSLSPTTKRVYKSVPFTVLVQENSYTQKVNAVQANLTYDSTKLDFVGIESKASAFEIKAQEVGGNGVVNIARGHVGTLSGKQLVAKVSFVPRYSSGKTNVNFDKESAVVRASDNTNILIDKLGGQYSLNRL